MRWCELSWTLNCLLEAINFLMINILYLLSFWLHLTCKQKNVIVEDVLEQFFPGLVTTVATLFTFSWYGIEASAKTIELYFGKSESSLVLFWNLIRFLLLLLFGDALVVIAEVKRRYYIDASDDLLGPLGKAFHITFLILTCQSRKHVGQAY